jgi:hypothetical protein
MWDKIHWLRQEIRSADDGDIICYADGDVLGLEACCFKTALAGADFGAVSNIFGYFNLGVMLWAVNVRTRKYIEAIADHGPYGPPMPGCEHFPVHWFLQNLNVRRLARNYNDFASAAGDRRVDIPVYFKAWHGIGTQQATRAIQEALNE